MKKKKCILDPCQILREIESKTTDWSKICFHCNVFNLCARGEIGICAWDDSDIPELERKRRQALVWIFSE